MARRYAALDVEATCLDPRQCRIVAAALLPFTPGEVRLSSLVFFAEPHRSEPEAALVHGLVGGVEQAGSFQSLIRAARGRVLVVYGRHDVELLRAEAERRGLGPLEACYVDVLEWLLRIPRIREKALTRGSLGLGDALEELLGTRPPPARFHDPVSDALHTAIIFAYLARRLGSPPIRCLRGIRRSLGVAPILRKLLGRLASR